MSTLDLYLTDKNLEKNGVWFELGPDLKFLCKRFGGSNAKEVKRLTAKYYRPYAKQIENGTLDEEKELEISARVFVESCLVDWIVPSGEAFSVEGAVKFFIEAPEVADETLRYANNYKSYLVVLGNS